MICLTNDRNFSPHNSRCCSTRPVSQPRVVVIRSIRIDVALGLAPHVVDVIAAEVRNNQGVRVGIADRVIVRHSIRR